MTESSEARPEGSCPWCGARAAEGATTCAACGAALAERESIGELRLPGVTAVDPALAAYDAQPWRLPRSSPSQGQAGGTIVAAAAMGGPAGLAAIAGLAALGATEYLTAHQDDGRTPLRLEDVGKPSESALQMLERLEAEEAAAQRAVRDAEAAEPGDLPGSDAGGTGAP